ncbi:hypothetical protein CEUSTIGMA_g12181.t1 [Chlamydomonas eustigma]|uniref:Multifunctional fusion protein n=1 Tax=Chlamydomonas eustigma TaxID=1157962 RepID=A0A250XP88_9CHLO|nr:hypothetical protein CEUSTIGMA_g12181.t1 [Chlamydomonas eustigma]|eukprot:GAX84759.1 hypothetical protein CEUSTIGMA_g12181.t1 [Chlamydomonas eustigma]
MDLVVDYRERATFQDLLPSDVTYENLEVGDFHLRCRDSGRHRVIFERKTLTDLAASIRDGRYSEQKCRMRAMREQVPGLSVGIVVEGDVNFAGPSDVLIGFTGVTVGAVHTAILRCTYSYGVPVTVVRGAAETVALLQHLRAKIDVGCVGGGGSSWLDTVRLKKADNVELFPRNLTVLQLCAIPRVSIPIANAVLDRLGCETIGELCARLSAQEDPRSVLTNVTVSGGKRRVGPAVAERLARSLSTRARSSDAPENVQANPSADTVAVYRAFFNGIARVLPCEACATSFQRYTDRPEVASSLDAALKLGRDALFEWTVRAHDDVNAQLGKNEEPYSISLARREASSTIAAIPQPVEIAALSFALAIGILMALFLFNLACGFASLLRFYTARS